jgi:hypothetical protein
VTVCIAGINWSQTRPLIIAACDRKISFYGGEFSAEGVAMKIAGINRNWSLMFSGPVSPMVPLIEAIKAKFGRGKAPTGVAIFARQCSEVYRAERRSIIENEVLTDYDIETYDEYLEQKKKEPELYTSLTERIKTEEESWSLLFTGFDSKMRPHIFVIKERGRIQYCDTEGFAAIGSGGWRSLVALSSYPFRRNLSLSQAVFGVAAAKFAAESQADGVGEDTVLAILEPKVDLSPVMSDQRVNNLRKLWKGLDRFPKDAESEIWEGLTEMTYVPGINRNSWFKALRQQQEIRALAQPPQKGSTQSGAQKSELGQ